MAEKLGANSSVSDAQQTLAEFSQTVFTDLQHDFHELNHEIPKDSVLEPFRHEYAKLFGILQKSMTNQARYIEKGRVIESEIVGNKAKVRTVSKLAEEDSKSISNLNDERDKKQAILTECLANLRDAMEENEAVNNEIANYENELEQFILEEKGHKDELNQLRARRAELTKLYEDLVNQIPQLQESNRSTSEKREQKDREIKESMEELKRIDEMVDSKQKEDQMERQRLFELERDREATRVRLKDTLAAVKDRQQEVSQESEAVKQLDKKVREQKRRFEAAKSDKQESAEKCSKFQKDLDQLNGQIAQIEASINESRVTLEERQNVASNLKKQQAAQETEREKMRLKIQGAQDRYENLRKETDAVRTKVDAAEDRIETLRREGEFTRKQIDAAVRDENARLKKKEGEVQRQNQAQTMLTMYRNQAHNIECEISIIKAHLQDTQKKIYATDTDRARYSEELSASTSQYLHAQEILKDIETKVAQKTAEIVEGDRRVAQQQGLYEKVRSEREVYSKKMKEVEAEITELESNFGRMKFAIEQHKEDIHRKDAEKARDIKALNALEEEDSRLREKLTDVEITINTSKSAIVANEAEISKSNASIKKAEEQLAAQMHKLDQAKKERDTMSNKNVEKEIEMRDMDQKLQVLKKQCKRGERDYDTKEAEIAKIRGQIQLSSDRLDELSQIDITLEERRKEVHTKQKELMQLRAERAAMEEELAIPINIHRWTLLESSDPARFEKLKRYQELQADLVARTKEVAELQDIIKAKEAQYVELAAQVRRRPGLEVEQRVAEYSDRCKRERFSLKQIEEELDTYRNSVKDYRKELSDVKIELINQRNKWIRQKKKDMKAEAIRQEVQADYNAQLSAIGVTLSEPM